MSLEHNEILRISEGDRHFAGSASQMLRLARKAPLQVRAPQTAPPERRFVRMRDSKVKLAGSVADPASECPQACCKLEALPLLSELGAQQSSGCAASGLVASPADFGAIVHCGSASSSSSSAARATASAAAADLCLIAAEGLMMCLAAAAC